MNMNLNDTMDPIDEQGETECAVYDGPQGYVSTGTSFAEHYLSGPNGSTIRAGLTIRAGRFDQALCRVCGGLGHDYGEEQFGCCECGRRFPD